MTKPSCAVIRFRGYDPDVSMVEVVPLSGEFASTDDIIAVIRSLDSSLALVLMSGVHFYNGSRADMESITRIAHEYGAAVGFDLAHAIGNVELHLHDWDVDFAVWCSYKYLNGGPGAPSFTWVAPSLVERAEQPLRGWLGHRDPFAFDQAFDPAPGIRRFVTGTQQVLSLAALHEALAIWEGISMRDVRAKSVAQTSFFIRRVEESCAGAGLALVSPRESDERGGHVSFSHPDGYAIMQALIAHGVIGDFRAPDILRFGFSPLYLAFGEIDRAVEILAEILRSRSWDRPAFARRRTVT